MKKLLCISFFLLSGCGESESISLLKGQVINQLDPTRTLGNALENRPRCSSYSWSENTDSAGRNVATYTCKMKPENSNSILQASFDQMIKDTKSAISTYNWQLERLEKSPLCTSNDTYNTKACDGQKSGKLEQITVSENGIKRFQNLKDNEISAVSQVISWSILKKDPFSAVMLSAKYVVKMDDGAVHDLDQASETLSDVYVGDERFNPVRSLARRLAPPICVNCQ